MIAVIGSTNLDIVYGVDHLTAPGETQTALNLNYHFGGKGANQAVTAAKISNQNILFSTSIGGDSEGKEVQKRFKKLRIEGYHIHQKAKTGRAFIEVDKTGENRIVIHPGANDLHSPEFVVNFLEEYKEDIKYCLIQNEIPAKSVEKALEILKLKNIKVIYDPAPQEKTEKDWLKGIDYLTPNETEFFYLKDKLNIKEENIEQEALIFKRKTGIKNLIIKRGSKDLIIINEDNEILIQKTFKTKVVDTTAAGDIFNAAFACALSQDNSLKDAVKYASAAAAVSVTKRGAQSSIPDTDEIKELLSR